MSAELSQLSNNATENAAAAVTVGTTSVTDTAPGQLRVIRRNGQVTPFNETKITVALTKAFLAVEGMQAAASTRVHETVATLTKQVVESLSRRLSGGGTIHIEDIQDQVELALMRHGEHKIARAYVLYRDEKARERAEVVETPEAAKTHPTIQVTAADGAKKPLNLSALEKQVEVACENLEDVTAQEIVDETVKNIFDGAKESDIEAALIMAARTRIEQDPNYTYVTARLLLKQVEKEAVEFLDTTRTVKTDAAAINYDGLLSTYIHRAIELELLSPELATFDIEALNKAIDGNRDLQFTYLGLQTLYDRYFIHSDETRFELPQIFWMRVAMGLALQEDDKNARAIEFYNLLSSFDYMSSTPTLFNAGTLRPQLSSCYLTTVPDSLSGIYGAMRDNAMLSKWAGGLGNDWTPVRALGARIKGTNGKSQGVVPFLKVANDTAVAVNQGGKRKGAVCAYLETWHIDVEEFLELRKNTGDDRRRTHDMNTANWVPDLFLKRVAEEQDWTLFSPDETPELHDLYGRAFEEKYTAYETAAANGEIRNFKTIKALDLWRKMLGMLFETGHPWVTFKDPCNIRSPQQHVGVVHSSNLCTEITLNTSDDEIAVCNLGSVNLSQHVTENGLDEKKLEKTVTTAMRMLDNVIDTNYYAVPQAKNSNLKHRPVGLGVMGFQDALYQQNIAYGSEAAVTFADQSMEHISYYSIASSVELAKERGTYETFKGSLWSQGILPIDSVEKLVEERGEKYVQINRDQTLDWDTLRKNVKKHGVRNSNHMAIAPTATISNICGVSQSIEPTYQNLYVKSNLSGEFTVVNPHLVTALKAEGLWDNVMINDLKYYNGSVQQIDRIPDALKHQFATAFEVEPKWLVEAASRRQKWIDQAQSLNLYIDQPSGKKLDLVYRMAWYLGLKTTYYLRSLGATQTEKSTVNDSGLNAVAANDTAPKMCSIDDPDCEACQ